MTVVRYNQESMEYELVDKLSGRVVEDGYNDPQAAKAVADSYNQDEEL